MVVAPSCASGGIDIGGDGGVEDVAGIGIGAGAVSHGGGVSGSAARIGAWLAAAAAEPAPLAADGGRNRGAGATAA
ncbi:MAG: hypothetical protein ACREO8_02115, partial [Luteimonas sp.]